MLNYLLIQYRSILKNEPEILNRARIKMLLQLMLAFICLSIILQIVYTLEGGGLLLVRMSILLVLFILGVVLLLMGKSWRAIAHYFIVCICLMIWTNVWLFSQGVNIVTVQYSFLIISAGYYLLGFRWGLFYSVVSMLPIVISVVFARYDGSSYHIWDQNINSTAFSIVLIFNFTLLIFIHYFFFKAFRKTNEKEMEFKAELQLALRAAEDVATAKTNFLSTMSHELRTPLNAVIGMVNLLRMGGTEEERKDNLNVLTFSAENLMSIINDILDFNKIEAGMVTLVNHDFRLDTLLKNVFGAFKAKADLKGLQFNTAIDPQLEGLYVNGDETRLTQILFNLVGNSVKFTKQGGVLLQAIVVDRQDHTIQIRFKIEDSGIGISKEQQVNIFDPFIQSASKSNRQYHGTGLGLAIAKRLVELHGGNLKLTSEEEEGTTFVFELNYGIIRNQHPVVEAAVSQPEISKVRVLVAEDNEINVMVVKRLLNKWDIEPDIAVNGQEAVDAVVAKDYDIVLMDINMPIMDGFEAAKCIRELDDARKSKISIVALTASIGVAIEEHEGYQYLDGCIIKPFKPEELKEKLHEIARNIS
ncbi:ATP-binding protein [Pedobacter sp. PWIIR3]